VIPVFPFLVRSDERHESASAESWQEPRREEGSCADTTDRRATQANANGIGASYLFRLSRPLGDADVSLSLIYLHVIKRSGAEAQVPLDLPECCPKGMHHRMMNHSPPASG